MSILLLGSSGYLGQFLVGAWERHGTRGVSLITERSVAGRRIDAERPDDFVSLIRDVRPRLVVNCIAAIPTPDMPLAARRGIAVNALLPHVLADACSGENLRLLHVSTDGVFSGARGPHAEVDSSDARDLYGRTKALGEVALPGTLTVRTTFVGFSPVRRGMLQWLVDQARAGAATVPGFFEYFFTPISLSAFLRIVAAAESTTVASSGIVHLPGPEVSKAALLERVSERLGLGTRVIPVAHERVDRRLATVNSWETLGLSVPSMENLLDDCAAEYSALTVRK